MHSSLPKTREGTVLYIFVNRLLESQSVNACVYIVLLLLDWFTITSIKMSNNDIKITLFPHWLFIDLRILMMLMAGQYRDYKSNFQ